MSAGQQSQEIFGMLDLLEQQFVFTVKTFCTECCNFKTINIEHRGKCSKCISLV